MRSADLRQRGITYDEVVIAAERGIRHYRYTVLRAPGQKVALDATVAEAVRDLISRAALAIGNAEQIVHLADVADPIAAARALTPEGRGADMVFEAVATPEAWQWAVQMARKGGLVNLFGGPPAGTSASFDTNLIHYSDLNIKASFHHTPVTAKRAFDLLCSGRFQCEDFLTGSASLEEVPELFKRMLTRPAEGTAPEIKIAICPLSRESATEPKMLAVEAA